MHSLLMKLVVGQMYVIIFCTLSILFVNANVEMKFEV